MNMFSLRNWCAPVAALLLTATVSAQPHLPPGHDLEVSDGVQFVLNSFDRHSIVAISDLPGCEELHQFLQTPQKLGSLSRGSINDAKSHLGCFPLELFDL